MPTPIDEPTLQEIREHPQPAGPLVGRSLLRLALVLCALGYLFTFVPPILSPTGDLLALSVLAWFPTRGLIRLLWRGPR